MHYDDFEKCCLLLLDTYTGYFMLDIFCRVWYNESDSIKKNHCSKVLIPVIYGEGGCVDLYNKILIIKKEILL